MYSLKYEGYVKNEKEGDTFINNNNTIFLNVPMELTIGFFN